MNSCRSNSAHLFVWLAATNPLNCWRHVQKLMKEVHALWRFSLATLIVVLMSATAANAAGTVTNAETAYVAYFKGRVLDAVQILEKAIPATADPDEKWSLASQLMDICIDSYQYQCLQKDWKLFNDASSSLHKPDVIAGKWIFVTAASSYFLGDMKFIHDNFGDDFALKDANPLKDPVLATKFFILNAAVQQYYGHFDEARKYINRAFASLLRVDTDTAKYDVAALLKLLIVTTFQNHDVARGLRWLSISDPVIHRLNGFDHFEYLTTVGTALSLAQNTNAGNKVFGEAEDTLSTLQVDPSIKEALLSSTIIAHSAGIASLGDFAGAAKQFATNPVRSRREAILKSGKFQNFSELYYAAAEIFFDRLSGKDPDERWQSLFLNVPDWRLTEELKDQETTYRQVALAFLRIKTNRDEARRMMNDAIRDRLSMFQKQRSDTIAFPLPSLLDRLIIGLGASFWTANGNSADGDLLIGSMELLNRDRRYAISDTLATIAAQKTDQGRRAAHAFLRLSDRQELWEIQQLQDLVNRMSEKDAFPKNNFMPQFTGQAYDNALQHISQDVAPANIKVPTLAELQSALSSSESFLGFVGGQRVCVRQNGIWSSPVFDPTTGVNQQQLQIDVKLILAALTAQYGPSDTLDSQFPVDSATRVYRVLLGGLSSCLEGAKHIIVFAPPDVAAIPMAALLKERPPALQRGYDLSKAHWLIFDYAFSQVVSIRDFISSRTISHRAPGNLLFAGIGDPSLNLKLADGRTGGTSVALRSGTVGAQSLSELSELPDTEVELKTIAATVGKSSTLLIGPSATEENFRALPLSKYEIIHFATHGLVRGDIPGLSEAALVLTPIDMTDEVNDGLLTTSDIANLNLSAKVVVLSACNTANFDPSLFNTQIQGFASAFAVAGVPATVASLWAVESKTSTTLMTNFYRHLLADNAPGAATALQQGIIDTIAAAPSRPFFHPRFWAPFVLLGDGATTIEKIPHVDTLRANVLVSSGGGEILNAIDNKSTIITSEIGTPYNGRYSSLISARSADGKRLWSVEDRKIGAGKIVQLGNEYVAAGYEWDGRSIPVLRGISFDGKVLWEVRPHSRFESTAIMDLSSDKKAIYLALAPLSPSGKNFDVDIVRLNKSAAEERRQSISAPLIANYGGTFSVSTSNIGSKLYVALSLPMSSLTQDRTDFGLISLCYRGSTAHVYKLDAVSLSVEKETTMPETRIFQLYGDGSRLIYAGSVHSECAIESERPVLGRIENDLSSALLWQDNTAFYGHLVSVVKNGTGYMAAAEISEPINITQPQVNSDGRVVSAIPDGIQTEKKHPDYLNDKVSEGVVQEFDRDGTLKSKRFFGNGLTQNVMGLVKGDKQAIVFGSDGFNPWFEPIQ